MPRFSYRRAFFAGVQLSHGMRVIAFLMLLTPALRAAPPARVGGTSLDSLIDIMPLAVGNKWTYSYFTSTWSNDDVTISDSGTAEYEISSVAGHPHYASWTVTERKFIRHCVDYYFSVGSPDTCWMDSSAGVFYVDEEYIDSRRPLSRLEAEPDIWTSVFAWSSDFPSDQRIFRYMPVDSTGHALVVTPPESTATRVYDFTFMEHLGLVSVTVRTGPRIAGVLYTADHTLLSTVLSSMTEGEDGSQPLSFTLEQNYPNPFNPSTSIRFSIGASGPVRLTVCDILGREVVTLANEQMSPGTHLMTWDASGLASGAYFLKLASGGATAVRRVLLVR